MITVLLNQFCRPTKNTKKSLLFLLLAFFALGNFNANAQVNTYSVQQLQITTPYTAVPVNVITGSPTTGSIDNGVYPLTLPFNFQFAGVPYTTANSINISYNGFLTFGTTAPAAAEYFPISGTGGYAGAISPFGTDLDLLPANASTLNISTQLSGAPGNQILKIQWTMKRSNGAGTALSVDGVNIGFQVWLYENGSVIEMHYNTNATVSANESLAQIGLRGSSNADFLNFNYGSPLPAHWPGIAPAPVGSFPLGTVNTQTVKLRGSAQILATSNRTIRFTPLTCSLPSAISVTNLITTATATWTPPSTAPAQNYDWEIRTSGAGGSGLAGLVQTNVNATSPLSITGLSPNTTYCFYVRSHCVGADFSGWSTGNCFTTLCAAVNVAYYRDFGAVVYGPPFQQGPVTGCFTQQNLGLGNSWLFGDSNAAPHSDSSMFDGVLVYNGQNPGNPNPANVWIFTEGINLTAGTQYKIDYLYGGSTSTTVQNKLQIAYGLAPNDASMTNQLDNHPNIKGSAYQNIVNFTPTATGVYYFGFKAYSANNQGQLFVDELTIDVSNCLKVINPIFNVASPSTAQLSWTSPAVAPASGYSYYVSTSNTPPTNGTPPTGNVSATSVILTGLLSNTQYYFWVRTRCSLVPEYGEWSAVVPFMTLIQPPTPCIPNPSSVDNQGIVNVTFNTINNTTSTQLPTYSNFSSQITNVVQGFNTPISIKYQTGFTYTTKVWIDYNDNGLFSDAGEQYDLGISTNANPTTLTGFILIPAAAPLGQHRMRVGGADIDLLTGYGAGQGPCYSGTYACFEDYTVNVVVTPPALTINISSSTQCANDPSPLVQITTPLANFGGGYSWFPSNGVTPSGAGYIFTNPDSQIYTLTGTQNTAPFSTNSVQFNYIATPKPTSIILTTPGNVTVSCPSAPLAITATGGVVNASEVYTENFNAGIPSDWLAVNNSTLGVNPALSAWTSRASGYTYGAFFSTTTFASNDNSGFVLTNGDAQGLGGFNNTTLTSKAINLTGYTSAKLTYYQHLRSFNNMNATVRVSTTSQTTGFTTIVYQRFSPFTSGGSQDFQQINIDLSAFAGLPNVWIQFNYQDEYGYWWGIDNFQITGNLISQVQWTPATGLYTSYTSPTVNTPYVAGTGAAVVYAAPTASTLYTATAATTVAPICSTSTSITITPTIVVGAVGGTPQSVCGDLASNLTLSGQTGVIAEWQSSPIVAFTTPTTIAGSAGATTLTGAMMGNISADTYYRVKITNAANTCIAYTSPVLISFASVSWNGTAWSNGTGPTASLAAVFNGPYTSALGTAGNLTACSVIVNSGNVVFSSGTTVNGPGATLTAINAVKVLGGSLTFNNNSSLLQVNEATNTGAINYKRDTTPMKIYDFTYWSSPVLAQEIHSFSTATLVDKFFFWDTTPAYYNWRAIPASPPYNMIVGKGYIIRAPQSFTTTPSIFSGVFTGVPINGLQTVAVETTALGTKDLNLVGNPYPSAIWADLFLTNLSNAALFNKTIYLWTHNTAVNAGSTLYNNNDYASYNLTGGVGTGSGLAAAAAGLNTNVPNGYIAAGQAFFIQGKTVGVGAGFNATFTNSMRVAGSNNQFFRNNTQSTTSIEKNRIWLEVSNGVGAYKQLLYGYIEGATAAKDSDFDGDMIDIGNQMNIYTLIGTNKMSIQGVGLPFNNQDLVPVGYKSTVSGNFDIQLSDFDGLFVNQNIYLEDKLLNVIVDLKQNPYTFTASPGTFNDRFVLRFTNGTLAVNTLNFNDTDVVVYKTKNDIHINTSNMNMKSVSIFDLRGRELFTKTNVNNNVLVVSNLNLAQQVIIVQVTNDQGITVNKKIVF